MPHSTRTLFKPSGRGQWGTSLYLLMFLQVFACAHVHTYTSITSVCAWRWTLMCTAYGWCGFASSTPSFLPYTVWAWQRCTQTTVAHTATFPLTCTSLLLLAFRTRVCIYAHTHTYTHTHTHTHMHMHTRTQTHACMHTRTHTSTHARAHMRTYTHTHACTHA